MNKQLWSTGIRCLLALINVISICNSLAIVSDWNKANKIFNQNNADSELPSIVQCS